MRTSSPLRAVRWSTCLIVCFLSLVAVDCRSASPPHKPQLLVAAAANLVEVFNDIAPEFKKRTGTEIVFSYGSTGDLARQIENGAPFDVFAAADTAYIDRLEKQGLLVSGSKAVYARGRLVIWIPPGSKHRLARPEDLERAEFERIAIAKPDVAPYGQAAVESLQNVGLWERLQPRVVYGQSVSQTKQFAATGNAEAAFIPLSLIKTGEGTYIEIDESLHAPIYQALGIMKNSSNRQLANEFVQYLLSTEGQELLSRKGFASPR